MRRCAIVIFSCLALALSAAPGASAASSEKGPPPGANDFSCKPASAHPNPVVLVHGLGATMSENWGYLSPLLKQRGYCVFALTYGLDPRWPENPGGVIPIEQSAPELGAFVDRVLAATGAKKIDLVGHSEGTFMPQYWLKFLGGAAKTRRYVAMTPLYDGTTVYGIDQVRDAGAPFGLSEPLVQAVAAFCGSCPEFVRGSPMQQKLAEGGKAAPGVIYTTSITKYDELVVPYTSGLLDSPNATNFILQDICPGDVSEHAAVATDPVNAQIVFNALDPARAQKIDCAKLPPPPAAGTGRPQGESTGKAVLKTRLRARVRGSRVRRLNLFRLPAAATVSVVAATHAAPGGGGRNCHLTRVFEAKERRARLRALFRDCGAGPGSKIRVRVSAPGPYGKLFKLGVLRSGKLRRETRLLGTS